MSYTEIRGSELGLGVTIRLHGRDRTVTYIRWGEAPWMLEPGHPSKKPAAQVETDANFSFTAYATDHFQRVGRVGEQASLAL